MPVHSAPPVTRDPRVSEAIARITVDERARFMLRQIAAGVDAPLPVSAMPENPRDRLLLPVLMPHQLKLAAAVLDPAGPSIIGVMGGIGVGKTAALAVCLVLVALTRPGSHSMLVGHTQKNLQKNVLPFIDRFLAQPQGVAAVHKYDAQAGCYVFDNGSCIWISHYRIARGAGEETNPIEGSNINGLFCVEEAEAINPNVIKHALDRLRGESVDVNGRLCGPTLVLNGRPAQSRWWMREAAKVAKKLKAAGGSGVAIRGGASIISKTAENYHNGPGYLANLKGSRTLEQFLAITECAPAPAEGAYYSDFIALDPDTSKPALWPRTNIVPAPTYGGPGLVRVSVDPGFNSPAAVVYRIVTVENPRTGAPIDIMVILATIAPDRVRLAGLVSEIHRICDAHEWTIEAGRGDPAMAQHGKHSGHTDYDILERDRDDYSDSSGPGLGVIFDPIEGQQRRIVLNGVHRLQVLICNALGERRLVCTDEYWRWAEAQEESTEQGAAQPRTWAYTVRAYTKDVVATKRTMRQDHDSTHMADAVRYAVAVDMWGDDDFEPSVYSLNEYAAEYDEAAELEISQR